MENIKNIFSKYYIHIGLTLLAILIIGLASYFYAQKQSGEITKKETNQLETIATSTATSTKTEEIKTETKTASPIDYNALSYEKAVELFAKSRMQFDNACQVFPNAPVFKNGTKVMLDNRAGVSRQITIGGTVYNLNKYSFKVITLSSSSLPKKLTVNCGTGVNNAQITLQ